VSRQIFSTSNNALDVPRAVSSASALGTRGAAWGSERTLIIIPAYNEQGAIRDVVEGARAALPEADVLVINDGSRDATSLEARSAGALVIDHPFNLGIGGAVQTGLKFARAENYDYVIRLDGDGQHNADEAHMILETLHAQKADLVVGSRFIDADVDWHIPWSRRVGITLFGWMVSLIIGNRATDTTSGFCGMNRRAIHVLATYLPQDYPDVEGRVIVHKAGLTQVELPVNMRARVAGVSSINTWKSIYYAFKVSVAVFTAALKDIIPYNPPVAEERSALRRRIRLVSPLRQARAKRAAAPVETPQPTPGESV
jgi:glycosyltransferase involved in cell wall biosynthesis